MGRSAFVERRRDPRQGDDACGDSSPTARRSIRHAEPLPGGRRARRARRLPVRPERESAARPEVRLQARLDAPPPGPRPGAVRDWPSGRSRRRLQRGAHRLRHLQHAVLAQERALAARAARSYQRLLGQGWTDAIKATHPDEPVYTFWDYLRQAWERNAGMRLDHILLSASLAPRLRETGVDAWVRGLPGASDHAPAWANIETDPRS